MWTKEKEKIFQDHKKDMKVRLHNLAKGNIYNDVIYASLGWILNEKDILNDDKAL